MKIGDILKIKDKNVEGTITKILEKPNGITVIVYKDSDNIENYIEIKLYNIK